MSNLKKIPLELTLKYIISDDALNECTKEKLIEYSHDKNCP